MVSVFPPALAEQPTQETEFLQWGLQLRDSQSLPTAKLIVLAAYRLDCLPHAWQILPALRLSDRRPLYDIGLHALAFAFDGQDTLSSPLRRGPRRILRHVSLAVDSRPRCW